MAPAPIVRCAGCRREHNAKLTRCPFCGAVAVTSAAAVPTSAAAPREAVGARLRREALALASSGRSGEALFRLVQALEHAPADPEALFLRGRLEAIAGRHRAAITAFRAALTLAPSDASIPAHVAASYAALGLSEARRSMLGWVAPRERISGLAPRALFSIGDDPTGYFALRPGSVYTCPRCAARHALDVQRFLDPAAARPQLPAISQQAFADLGVADGFDLACTCGLEARLVFQLTEHPARSGEFVPCVKEVLELSPTPIPTSDG